MKKVVCIDAAVTMLLTPKNYLEQDKTYNVLDEQ